MTLEELRQLKQQIADLLPKREKEARDEALRQIREIAKSVGVSVDELLGGKPSNPIKLKTAPVILYRDPGNAENAWSGRGPRPRWLKAALDAGKTLEELRST